ncbi:MAG: hypothetical protein AAB966_04090, partial [Patescibacteria group bacterium]
MNQQLLRVYDRVLKEHVPIRFLTRDDSAFNVQTQIIKMLNEDNDLYQIVNEFPVPKFFGPLSISDILMMYVRIYKDNGTSFDELVEIVNDYFRSVDLERAEEDREGEVEKKYFSNGSELQSSFDSWYQDVEKEYSKDQDFAIKMEIYSKEVFNIEPVKISEFKMGKIDVLMKPKRKYDTEEIIEVFNEIVLSERLCFASLYVNDNLYSKIYTGDDKIKTPNYSSFIPSMSQIKLSNKLTIVFWTGADDFYKGVQVEFNHAVYDIDENTFRIEQIDAEVSDFVVDVIRKSCNIEFEDSVQPTKISGSFYFLDSFKIDPIPMLHIILTDWRFFAFMFVNETDRPAADKKGLRVRYRGIGGEVSGEDSSLSALAASLQNELIDGKERSLIKISGGFSDVHIQEFIEVITRVIKIYIDEADKIAKEYYDIVPLTQIKGKLRVTSGGPLKEAPIYALRRSMPDAFIENYTTNCPNKQQPSIITPEERHEYEEESFNIGKTKFSRQVLEYPPLEPKILLGCPSPDYPFPGIRKNTLENKDKYPYFPCCFKSNHMDDPNSDYRRFVEQRKKETVKVAHHVKTLKSLDFGQTGSVPTSLGTLLAKYKDGAKADEFIRIGVVKSPNAIIHAILYASEHPEYAVAKTNERREQVARKMRALMSNETFYSPYLVKQEMFDFSDEEISKILKDSDTPLNISLFYHLLEIALTANIFVFKSVRTDTGTIAEIDLPRCKFYSIRNVPPDNPSVLLIRNDEDPDHVEIIGHFDGRTKTVRKIFGTKMTYTLNTTYMSSTNLNSWVIEDDVIIGRKYLSNIVDYGFLNTENTKILAQVIDDYGKARGFVVNTPICQVTVFTPPTQPINLNRIDERSVPECSMSQAIKIFGTPIGRSEIKGKTDGLWYQFMGIKSGLYVPIVSNSDRSLPILQQDPLRTFGVGIADKISKLRRTGLVMLQLVIYLYILSGRDRNKIESSIRVEKISDSSYDVKALPIHLPEFKGVDAAIKWFEKRIPTVFKDGALIAYSEKLKVNLMGKIDEWENATKGLRMKPERHIKGLFQFESDFNYSKDTALFLRQEDLVYWMNQQKNLSLTVPIYESLNPTLLDQSNEPILYLDGDNILLIQKILRLAPAFYDD